MTVVEYVTVSLAAAAMLARIAMLLPRPAKRQANQAA
jgi:hypothetical protein